jgi:hypothetical protein
MLITDENMSIKLKGMEAKRMNKKNHISSKRSCVAVIFLIVSLVFSSIPLTVNASDNVSDLVDCFDIAVDNNVDLISKR